MAIVAATNQALPVFEYAARQVKQTVVGIGSAEKSRPAYGAHLAAARQSAGGCGGCAGDRHHPLPCQPECRSDQRDPAQSGAGRYDIEIRLDIYPAFL